LVVLIAVGCLMVWQELAVMGHLQFGADVKMLEIGRFLVDFG
jgi:hypothetical protein